MLSRVAENLYWISRYVERAENVARLLDVGFPWSSTRGAGRRRRRRRDRRGGAGDPGLPRRPSSGRTRPGDRDAVLRFLTFDRQHRHSILAMIARARENARGTQEALSAEAWSQVNTLYLYLGSPRAQRRFAVQPLAVLRRHQAGLRPLRRPGRRHPAPDRGRSTSSSSAATWSASTRSAGSSTSSSTASASGGAGRRARRCGSSTGRACCGAARPTRRTCASTTTGSTRRGSSATWCSTPTSPAPCGSASPAACESLRAIADGDGGDFTSEAERLLGRLDSELRYIDVGEIFGRGLAPFLTGIQDDLQPDRRRDPPGVLLLLIAVADDAPSALGPDGRGIAHAPAHPPRDEALLYRRRSPRPSSRSAWRRRRTRTRRRWATGCGSRRRRR